MIIDDRIFNELEEVNLETDDGMELLDEYAARVWDHMTPKEQHDFCEGNDVDEDDPDEGQDVFHDEMIENTIGLYKVPKDSLLEYAIFTYGQAKFDTNLFDTFDRLGLVVIGNEAYFDVGCGYNWIDHGLLNGDGSGDTKKEFLKIINQI